MRLVEKRLDDGILYTADNQLSTDLSLGTKFGCHICHTYVDIGQLLLQLCPQAMLHGLGLKVLKECLLLFIEVRVSWCVELV